MVDLHWSVGKQQSKNAQLYTTDLAILNSTPNDESLENKLPKVAVLIY